MKETHPSRAPFLRRGPGMRRLGGILAIALLLGLGYVGQTRQSTPRSAAPSEAISASEFSRVVNEFSEHDGFFRSDNFVSNETSYLHILNKLKQIGATGGAYIGVGPEQNFTYIAKVRPSIAFIVDIRRRAVIQHLMFKAIFHLAPTRTHFLSLLFSKPVSGSSIPRRDATAEELVDYFGGIATSDDAYEENCKRITQTIEKAFLIDLRPQDIDSLQYIYSAFRDENLDIQYRFGGYRWPGRSWRYFPTFRELILATDLNGRRENFLAAREDYEFVRRLEERNRVIPVVGNLAGRKALPSVAAYLQENGYTVSAFYTSNVEQYLFSNGEFDDFARNVAKLPINGRSLFIRSYPNSRMPHPAYISGHRLTTLLQRMDVFLRDYRQGLYYDYWALVTTHYIAAQDR